ncbi:MAG: hypothetical protein ACLFQS_10600 [Bacteroidales bacterium]
MKNINVRILAVLLITVTFLSSCGLNKMIKDYGEGVSFTPETNPLENHGGEVAIEVTGSVSEKYFHPNAKVELIPVLKYDGGERELNVVYLRGEKTSGEGTVINRNSSTTFSFSEVVPFQEEFKESELVLRADVYREGDADESVSLPEVKVADGVIVTSQRVANDQDLALAAHGYEKETFVSETANIYFDYMRHNINWRFSLNRDDEAQQEIEDFTEFLKRQWKVKSLEVSAWASPEGEVAYNEELSEDRAESASVYVERLIDRLEDELDTLLNVPELIVAAKGEDFDGFMESLNASDIQDKQAIANVINSQLEPAEREKRIKDMTVIYAEVEELLKPLRRAELVATLFEPKKSDEEIAMLATENPAELDVKELLYAATMVDESNMQKKLEIYNNAKRLFPQDYRGFNNAAYVNLAMGNKEDAAQDLEKANQLAPNNGHVQNNLGVIASWEKDIENALSYFESAQAQGVDVDYNVGIMMILKGDYQAALTSFAGRTCTGNVALAHMMNDDLDAAMTNLECAQETAQVAYLKAVVGARRDNETMVFENLEKAINMDSSLREEAEVDREFIQYFSRAEFEEALQ